MSIESKTKAYKNRKGRKMVTIYPNLVLWKKSSKSPLIPLFQRGKLLSPPFGKGRLGGILRWLNNYEKWNEKARNQKRESEVVRAQERKPLTPCALRCDR
jgi:hypothetical protein